MRVFRLAAVVVAVGWAVIRGVEEAIGMWVERATRPVEPE